MGAINGEKFVNRLNQMNTEIWLDGKKVVGEISKHPALKGHIQ